MICTCPPNQFNGEPAVPSMATLHGVSRHTGEKVAWQRCVNCADQFTIVQDVAEHYWTFEK